MLILSRGNGKAILIGDEILIRVLNTNEREGEVELLIEAPESTLLDISERINAPKKNVIITHKRKSRDMAC